jgi:hypothetical protein
VRTLVIGAVVGGAFCLWASASPAHAGKPTLVALAPASDARKAVAIGPTGEVYEPDGKGAWIRRQAGGTAVELVGAVTVGGVVLATSKAGIPFKLKGSGWTVAPLGLKSKAIMGAGSRVLAAVGSSVFAFDKSSPTKLTDAPAPITMIAASAAGAVIATSKGLLRLEGAAWKPIKKAPKSARALVSDRWIIVDKGALDLKTMNTIAWPARVKVGDATTVGESLYAVADAGKTLELLTVKAGKVERETIPLPGNASIVGLVADRAGRVVVAARDGKLAVRVKGEWTASEVRVELAAAKPGPPPALSQSAPP